MKLHPGDPSKQLDLFAKHKTSLHIWRVERQTIV